MKYAIEHIVAYGHKNIKATHKTTFEVTSESWLTPRGDCIIGVKASKAPKDLNVEFKKLIQRDDTIIIAILITNNIIDVVVGRGSHSLTLSDNTRMVFRKSNYTCPKTVMVNANKAAIEINRELVRKLRELGEKAKLHVILLAINQHI